MLSEGERGGYSDGWLDRLPPNGSLGTEAVDMSIDCPLEGTKHPPRPFHLSSFPWLHAAQFMVPEINLDATTKPLLNVARASSAPSSSARSHSLVCSFEMSK